MTSFCGRRLVRRNRLSRRRAKRFGRASPEVELLQLPPSSIFESLADAGESSDKSTAMFLLLLSPSPAGVLSAFTICGASAWSSSAARLTERRSPFCRVMRCDHSSRRVPLGDALTTVMLASSATETVKMGDGAGDEAFSVSLLVLNLRAVSAIVVRLSFYPIFFIICLPYL